MLNIQNLIDDIRGKGMKLMKANRNEDRQDTIVANVEACIHLATAANALETAQRILCPFDYETKPQNPKPQNRKPQNRSQEEKGKVNTAADVWSSVTPKS